MARRRRKSRSRIVQLLGAALESIARRARKAAGLAHGRRGARTLALRAVERRPREPGNLVGRLRVLGGVFAVHPDEGRQVEREFDVFEEQRHDVAAGSVGGEGPIHFIRYPL